MSFLDNRSYPLSERLRAIEAAIRDLEDMQHQILKGKIPAIWDAVIALEGRE